MPLFKTGLCYPAVLARTRPHLRPSALRIPITLRPSPFRLIHRPASPHFGNRQRCRSRWLLYPSSVAVLIGAGVLAFEYVEPFRHTVLAANRCSRVAAAAVASVIDYKTMMWKTYPTLEEENQAYSDAHTRSAQRVLRALLANGGIFIKLGQHMAAMFVLPVEWTRTMAVLQDRCEPTPYEDLQEMFLHDMGGTIDEIFEDFDPEPIGVASLAQVHVARHRATGRQVAVKLQHPHLAEFCDVDIKMVDVTLGWVKALFPQFEFTWLAGEMKTNLPKEMDFKVEASNAARTVHDFEPIRSPLYIPEVVYASKRVLIMEYIQGGRVDDLVFLSQHGIDRNKVAIELSHIFNRMVFLNGWFHADPHPGNLLIRSAPKHSKSPYNFEIVLLDHGLYFDLTPELRFNYSKLWLSLMAPASTEIIADRRKYAQLVGNIGPELYPVFEAAITGRVALEGSWDEEQEQSDNFARASSMIDMSPQTDLEKDAIRNAVTQRDGLLLSVFDVLRRVPSRVLMVLKLNDLTRSLDYALETTHSNIRVFLVMAKYCSSAVWQNDRQRLINEMKVHGLLSKRLLCDYFSSWWSYEMAYTKVSMIELFMDLGAMLTKSRAWVWGLWSRGLEGAHNAASGLSPAGLSIRERSIRLS